MKTSIKSSAAIVVLSHIIIWFLLIELIFDFSGLLESLYFLFTNEFRFIDEALLILPSMIALFYWNSSYLIPNYLNSKSWWKYLLAISIGLLVLVFVGHFIFQLFLSKGYASNLENHIDFFDIALDQYLIVIGISTSLGVSKIAMENARQKKLIGHKLREAEIKYLNNHFNAHFLFNTINSIYSLAIEEEAEQTTTAILKLSEIMRYPIKHGAKPKVALVNEIQFVKDYIGLIVLRLGENYPIHFDIKGDFQNKLIAPLLFIPIVENSFKYGISSQHKTPISFSLSLEKDSLVFTSQNTINPSNIESFKTGIAQLTQRLELLYPQNYTYTNSVKGDTFFVVLKIDGVG